MLAAAVAVVGLAAAYNVSTGSWATLVLAIGIVLTAETMNTAIETLADRVESTYDDQIRETKDIAAGAVLLSAIAAAVVGVITLWPYMIG